VSDTAPIALTGGTGFVGQAVLDTAAGRNLPIAALARRIPLDDTRAERWIGGDLGNVDALTDLVGGARALVHVAGLTNTPDSAQFSEVNVTGTQNVIDAVKAAGVKRLVFVSSLSARKPELSAYGSSKAAAEELVQTSGLDWTIVRPPGVYGPRDVDYFEMFRTAKLGFVPLPPRGASSIIHADDLSRLLLDLVDGQPALVRKKIFEPDDGREGGWSHKELAAAIGRAVGRRVVAPHLPATLLSFAASADKLLRGSRAKLTQDRVGYMCHPNWVARFDRKVPAAIWQPQIAGEEGLATTAAWYRAQGWL